MVALAPEPVRSDTRYRRVASRPRSTTVGALWSDATSGVGHLPPGYPESGSRESLAPWPGRSVWGGGMDESDDALAKLESFLGARIDGSQRSMLVRYDDAGWLVALEVRQGPDTKHIVRRGRTLSEASTEVWRVWRGADADGPAPNWEAVVGEVIRSE